jgi:hypothetical protein
VIPRDFILEWREHAPWPQDFQVEQDLIISRALVEIFSNPVLNDALAFRGGTALYKLHLRPAARYSEDIDLVQTRAVAAGPMMDALRDVLTPWLGKPQWKQSDGRITFVYRIHSEDTPPIPLKFKVETNTREHFSVYGLQNVPFGVSSRWFEGSCNIQTYALDELLGTKMRALYQRKQGLRAHRRRVPGIHASGRPCDHASAIRAELLHEAPRPRIQRGHRATRGGPSGSVGHRWRSCGYFLASDPAVTRRALETAGRLR